MARKKASPRTRHPRLVLRISPFGALWSGRQVDPAEGVYEAYGRTPGETLDVLLAKVPDFEPEDLPVILDLRERPLIVINLAATEPTPPVFSPTVYTATSAHAGCEGLSFESSDPYGAAVKLLKAAGLFEGVAGVRIVTHPEFKAYAR